MLYIIAIHKMKKGSWGLGHFGTTCHPGSVPLSEKEPGVANFHRYEWTLHYEHL